METIYACSILSTPPLRKASPLLYTKLGMVSDIAPALFAYQVTNILYRQSVALLHQKSYPTIRSTGGQELLAVLSAGELDAADGP